MTKMGVFHFYPERIAWIGAAILGFGFCCVLPFLLLLQKQVDASFIVNGRKEKTGSPELLTFSLNINDKGPVLPIPELQGEMTFSFDPPRPIGNAEGQRLLVRLRKSSDSRRVVLPCRLDLEFQGDRLVFSPGRSSFWLELSLTEGGQIEGKGFLHSLEGGLLEAGGFLVAGQESPVQGPQEFGEGTPFRVLAEARWWGRDQFFESKSRGERIEIGSGDWVELTEDDWVVWKDQKWVKSSSPETEAPIAHIQSYAGKNLVLEGWDANGHVRFSLPGASGPPFKVRGEDLLSAIRVRSEKQISCMLEKQCLVLKTGDWVLKTGGRWKILRKKDERDAFINGKLSGDLFVFEQIVQKQGQKMVVGKLYNPGRTQMIAIEMSAQSGRKGMRKGKSP